MKHEGEFPGETAAISGSHGGQTGPSMTYRANKRQGQTKDVDRTTNDMGCIIIIIII